MLRTTRSSAALLAILILAGALDAAERPPEGWAAARSPVTGLLTYLAGPGRGPLPEPASPDDPLAILRAHGALFGVADPARELAPLDTSTCALGDRHHRYQQVHRGIPVFTGRLHIHQRPDGTFLAVNGDFYPIPAATPLEPMLPAAETAPRAAAALGWGNAHGAAPALVLVDPRWYGDPPAGVRLAWHARLESPGRAAEWVLVDAIGGALLDHWPAEHSAIDREVSDGTGGGLPGVLVRAEGDPPTGDADVDSIYDYTADVYQLLFDGFGRDGIDGFGGPMRATVHWQSTICPNAAWNGIRTLYCDGLADDDVAAHEFAHGVTQLTADLIYQNQPGQLNESFSDVIGELVDLWNGNAALPGPPGASPAWPPTPTGGGGDTPNDARSGCGDGSVRWKIGEDTIFSAIRDMWQPDCHNHPPSTVHPLYQSTCCNPNSDNGGVHRGSGVPNHAFAMLVDGKTYDGITVLGIGATKAGAIWFRAQTVYLTPATFFADAAPLFLQAANDLVGTVPLDPRTGLPSGAAITAIDAAQVALALAAVQFDAAGLCGVGAPPPNDECADAIVVGAGLHPFDSTSATDGSLPSPASVCPGTALGVVGKDVWFSFTPPVDGLASFSTCGIASFDTDLVIYTGDCGALVAIACDGDTSGCSTFTSQVLDLPVSGGETLRVRIGAWEALVGWPGELSIEFDPAIEICDNGLDDEGDGLTDCDDPDCAAAPVCQPWPGDDCATALPAVLGANPLDTTGADDGVAPLDPAICAGTGLGAVAKDVWYSFTPVETGILTVSTCDAAGFDTDIVVYTGACGGLGQVACGGDGAGCAVGTSVVDLLVIGSVPLRIRVGGRTPADIGTGTLALSLFVPPEACANGADDDFDGATDCADPDCIGAPPCVCEPIAAMTCAQGAGLSVGLSWTNGEVYDEVIVRRDGLVIATLPGSASAYLDAFVSPGLHLYRVNGICPIAPVEASCPIDVLVPVTFTLIAPDLAVDVPVATGTAAFTAVIAIAEDPGAAGYPNGTRGFSFGLAHDPALLAATSTASAGVIAALGGGAGPDFYADWIGPGGVTVSVIYSAVGGGTLTFPAATPVVTIDYGTVPGGLAGATGPVATPLSFASGIGVPPVTNAVLSAGISYGTIADDGVVTLVPVVSGFERGDCNADAAYDLADPILALAVLFSGGLTTCLDACDANDDGQLNIADAIFSLTALFGGGQSPPLPFGACGADPTTDPLDCASAGGC